jgi:hypothetical protein
MEHLPKWVLLLYAAVGDRLIICKTKNLADLKTAPQKTVFIPPPGKMKVTGCGFWKMLQKIR